VFLLNVTFSDVKNNLEIRTYITQADASLIALGFTEHSFAHVGKCAETASTILTTLGYGEREVELARIAAYMHDIGNVINRSDHAQSGAVMAFHILNNMGMEPADVAAVTTAIGHHDESTAFPVNAIAAALILADKTDVRRSRVRNKETSNFDIHDRVNYAVEQSAVTLDTGAKTIKLTITINNDVCAVMDYFEIFLGRMLLCRKAAEFFGLAFKLDINGLALL
jgi:metal-dependent HD superfamily phosphatase/phosphodiesterase